MDTSHSPYLPPGSNLDIPLMQSTKQYRKNLVPKWIKFFGWLFIVVGSLVPFVGIFSAISGIEGEFSFYGLQEKGSVLAFVPLLIIALFVAHAICAYGLLFGKSWGVISCLTLAYISTAICIFTMFSVGSGSIRLELLLLIPYIIKLHKIRKIWTSMPLDETTNHEEIQKQSL